MMNTNYEITNSVEIELGGRQIRGRYRVMNGSVIVYHDNKLKFSDYEMSPPEVVAKWLLTDLSR
jgi:hypothetical protein